MGSSPNYSFVTLQQTEEMKMDFKTMKNSHEVQIKALLESDYDTFKSEFSINLREPFDGIHNHHGAWGFTGTEPHSLFGNLPEADRCLTQVKNHPGDAIEWHDKLDLGNNDLIPTNIQEDTVLNEAQLREFYKVQLEANFLEEVP